MITSSQLAYIQTVTGIANRRTANIQAYLSRCALMRQLSQRQQPRTNFNI